MKTETIKLNPCAKCGEIPHLNYVPAPDSIFIICKCGSSLQRMDGEIWAHEWNILNPVWPLGKSGHNPPRPVNQPPPPQSPKPEPVKLNPCRVCGKLPKHERHAKSEGEYSVVWCCNMASSEDTDRAYQMWHEQNQPEDNKPESVACPLITLNPCNKCGKAPTIEPRINGVYYRCCKVESFELNETTAINFWNLINPKLIK